MKTWHVLLLWSIATSTASALAVPPSNLQLATIVKQQANDSQLLAFTAYVDDNWDIFTWDFDPEHEPVQRTRTPYDESAPSLAMDQAFCVYETVDGRLWQLDLRTERAPRVLPFGSDQKLDMHPAVSPRGTQVALATSLDRTSDNTDLIIYSTSSRTFGRPLQLLSFQHYPAWAPDGRHIAFANLHGRLQTGRPISEIWVMRSDAPWARQMTLLDAFSISPAWSPDGGLIAFASNRKGRFDIQIVDTATRAVRPLTDQTSSDTDPVFGPDGRKLIFVSTRSGHVGLWRQSLDKNDARAVTPFAGRTGIACKDPDWR